MTDCLTTSGGAFCCLSEARSVAARAVPGRERPPCQVRLPTHQPDHWGRSRPGSWPASSGRRTPVMAPRSGRGNVFAGAMSLIRNWWQIGVLPVFIFPGRTDLCH